MSLKGDPASAVYSKHRRQRNYYDIETKEKYWISGCRKDGRDALYNTTAEIDEDALEEYWVNIRKQPANKEVRRLSVQGKY